MHSLWRTKILENESRNSGHYQNSSIRPIIINTLSNQNRYKHADMKLQLKRPGLNRSTDVFNKKKCLPSVGFNLTALLAMSHAWLNQSGLRTLYQLRSQSVYPRRYKSIVYKSKRLKNPVVVYFKTSQFSHLKNENLLNIAIKKDHHDPVSYGVSIDILYTYVLICFTLVYLIFISIHSCLCV